MERQGRQPFVGLAVAAGAVSVAEPKRGPAFALDGPRKGCWGVSEVRPPRTQRHHRTACGIPLFGFAFGSPRVVSRPANYAAAPPYRHQQR